MDRFEFESCVRELESFYGGTILNGGIMEATWFETLKHLPLQKLQVAIGRCFKKHPRQYNFFPSADQILEFAQGEYRPPGENMKQNFKAPALPSHEARLTPEQIAEQHYRGRLSARIILNSAGWMTIEEKEHLIKQLQETPTHELERIVEASEKTKPKGKGFNNLAKILENIEQNCIDGLPNEYEERPRKKHW